MRMRKTPCPRVIGSGTPTKQARRDGLMQLCTLRYSSSRGCGKQSTHPNSVINASGFSISCLGRCQFATAVFGGEIRADMREPGHSKCMQLSEASLSGATNPACRSPVQPLQFSNGTGLVSFTIQDFCTGSPSVAPCKQPYSHWKSYLSRCLYFQLLSICEPPFLGGLPLPSITPICDGASGAT